MHAFLSSNIRLPPPVDLCPTSKEEADAIAAVAAAVSSQQTSQTSLTTDSDMTLTPPSQATPPRQRKRKRKRSDAEAGAKTYEKTVSILSSDEDAFERASSPANPRPSIRRRLAADTESQDSTVKQHRVRLVIPVLSFSTHFVPFRVAMCCV